MYLALILTSYCAPLRIKGKFQAAFLYGHIAKRIFQRFSERGGIGRNRNPDFLLAEFILHGGILPLKDHCYSESLETFLDIHRLSLKQGETETGMISAMHFPLSYYASGMPLNPAMRAKLALFEEKAQQLQQPAFAAIFHCSKAVLMNLQGKTQVAKEGRCGSYSHTEIEGEEKMLSKLQAKSRGMTSRDFCIYRLFLACIFHDLGCMEQMLEQLESSPFFDLSLVRQYMRLTYSGIASFLLARTSSKKKRHRKVGNDIVRYLKKLDISDDRRVGGVNTRPVLLCLKAVGRNRHEDYVKAIEACDHARLIHLQALMSELCGRYCLSALSGADGSLPNDDADRARGYLGRALWLYQDWGAFAKVKALREEFEFLSRISRRDASAAILIPEAASMSSSSLLVRSLFDEGSISSHRSRASRSWSVLPGRSSIGGGVGAGPARRSSDDAGGASSTYVSFDSGSVPTDGDDPSRRRDVENGQGGGSLSMFFQVRRR
jgi:hypothetical protein